MIPNDYTFVVGKCLDEKNAPKTAYDRYLRNLKFTGTASVWQWQLIKNPRKIPAYIKVKSKSVGLQI